MANGGSGVRLALLGKRAKRATKACEATREFQGKRARLALQGPRGKTGSVAWRGRMVCRVLQEPTVSLAGQARRAIAVTWVRAGGKALLGATESLEKRGLLEPEAPMGLWGRRDSGVLEGEMARLARRG